jgi:regulator of RNase E activity RraA
MSTVNAFAQQHIKLTQGIYNVRDANLLIGTPITVKMTSSNDSAMIIVIDSDQTIQALVRLNPKVTQQVLPPLDYNYSIIIYGTGSVAFS